MFTARASFGSFGVRSLACGMALSGLLGVAEVARGQTAAPAAPSVPHGQLSNITPRQQAWQAATLAKRMQLAEKIGDEGARAFAKSKGWATIFNGSDRTLPQGLDQVYRDLEGCIHVVEAKGGSSPLGRGYSYPQGTPEWAVEAAKRMHTAQSSTPAMRDAAKEVLDAAAAGRLKTDVVRTTHVQGEPMVAKLEKSLDCSPKATQLAKEFRAARAAVQETACAAKGNRGASRGAGRGVKGAPVKSIAVSEKGSAGVLGKSFTVVKKAAPVVGTAIELGHRANEARQIENDYQEKKISDKERVNGHAKNLAGSAGGLAGAAAGAEVMGTGGAAVGSVFGPFGTVIGGVVGGVGGGVVGYMGGEKGAEYIVDSAQDQIYEGVQQVRAATSSAANWLGW